MGYVLSGQGSAVNNGQLVPWYRSGNYYPRQLGPTGPGGNGVPAYPPQSAGPGNSSANGSSSAQGAQTAAANPWSPVNSPVPWLIGFLVVGVLLLRFVHHGY